MRAEIARLPAESGTPGAPMDMGYGKCVAESSGVESTRMFECGVD